MIAPLAPFTLRGVVWYQGESNVGHAANYARLFPVMIRDWRAWFERELPFAFVQLPGFGGYRPRGAMAELRDAQRRALALPGTAMVVSIDLGDGSDIHGASKAAIGLRLASWALADLYGRRDLPSAGPLYRTMLIEPWGCSSSSITPTAARGGDDASRASRSRGDFPVPDAWAVIADDNVVVRSPHVPAPVAVRYAGTMPVASLRNRAGLPARRGTDDGSRR
jgi:sialate O-acetylesterase